MNRLEICKMSYSYDNKRYVLKNVDSQLEAGKMYAILGPSGCGKTTLLSYLAVWIVRRRGRFFTTDKILGNWGLPTTEGTMLHLFFKVTT